MTQYPFIFDDRPKLAFSDWLKLITINLIAFILLTTPVLTSIPLFEPNSMDALYHPHIGTVLRELVPGIVFLAINFLGLYWVTGKAWRKLFRPLPAKAFPWIFLFIVASVSVTYFSTSLADILFSHETNPSATLSMNHSGAWNAYFLKRVADIFQLLGEEFLAIVPFLALTQLGFSWGWSKKTALAFGLVFSSILFGAYHISTYGYNIGFSIVSLMFGRMVMTGAFMKYKSIWMSFAVHYLYDALAFLLSALLSR